MLDIVVKLTMFAFAIAIILTAIKIEKEESQD